MGDATWERVDDDGESSSGEGGSDGPDTDEGWEVVDDPEEEEERADRVRAGEQPPPPGQAPEWSPGQPEALCQPARHRPSQRPGYSSDRGPNPGYDAPAELWGEAHGMGYFEDERRPGYSSDRGLNPGGGRAYDTPAELRGEAHGMGYSKDERLDYWGEHTRPVVDDQARAAEILRAMGVDPASIGQLGAPPGSTRQHNGRGGATLTPTPTPTGDAMRVSLSNHAAIRLRKWRSEPIDVKERRKDPNDGRMYSYEGLSTRFWEQCGEDWGKYDEDGVREYWFESCLVDHSEQRKNPDDNEVYTFRELKARFSEYGDDDLKAYWRDACWPAVVSEIDDEILEAQSVDGMSATRAS